MGKVLDMMVWIHALWEEFPHKEEAKEMIKNFEDEIIIPFSITSEIFNVLTKKVGMKFDRAYKFLKIITSKYQTYVPTGKDYFLAMKITKDYETSIFDALILAICKKNNFDLITFDERLSKLLES